MKTKNSKSTFQNETNPTYKADNDVKEKKRKRKKKLPVGKCKIRTGEEPEKHQEVQGSSTRCPGRSYGSPVGKCRCCRKKNKTQMTLKKQYRIHISNASSVQQLHMRSRCAVWQGKGNSAVHKARCPQLFHIRSRCKFANDPFRISSRP